MASPVHINNRYNDKESVAYLTLMNIVNVLINILVGAVVMNAFSYANSMGFGWWYRNRGLHIYLCVFGYLLLMTQGMQVLQNRTSWARALNHKNKTTIHIILQVLGSILVLTGTIMKLLERDYYHSILTIHGIFGIISMVLTVINLICGVSNLYINTLRFKKLIEILHPCIGCFTIVAAFVAVALGFNEFESRYASIGWPHANVNLSISLTIIALLGILISPSLNILRLISK